VVKAQYAGCREDAAVVLYRIEGGGHAWPGGQQYLPEKIIGKTSQNLDASAVIWEFFQGSTRR
jgi:polyhydroxybutyrate depolymerase